jgi:hypothetical protein
MADLLKPVKPLLDRGVDLAGSTLGTAARGADMIVGRLRGRTGGPKAGMDDTTLRHKVESALARLPGVADSKINVTAVDGHVTLHGEVRNQTQMKAVQTAVLRVPEVVSVDSQLHLPKTPAPSTPRAGQRQQRRKAAPRTTARSERVNRDKVSASAADSPRRLAETGEGRRAAPLGSTGKEGSGTARAASKTASARKPAPTAKKPATTRRSTTRARPAGQPHTAGAPTETSGGSEGEATQVKPPAGEGA